MQRDVLGGDLVVVLLSSQYEVDAGEEVVATVLKQDPDGYAYLQWMDE